MSDVTIDVINPDGTDGGHALDPQEVALMDDAVGLLNHLPAFRQAYPGATLSRVESYRGVVDTQRGRMYLRFEVPHQAATEFWARWGKKDSVSFKRGTVTVAQPSGASP